MIDIQKEIELFLDYEGLEPPSLEGDIKDFLSNFTDAYYIITKIKKASKSKGYRIIQAPVPNLKSLQQKTLLDLNSKIVIHKDAYGLNQNDFKANALRHQDSKEILCIDLKNFYQTINSDMVLSKPILKKNYWLYLISSKNTICIPTGSPLSPIVSTIIMEDIDKELSLELEKLEGIYTRYFDDITVSFKNKLTGDQKSHVFYKVFNSLKSTGLQINWSKTKWLVFNNDKIKITGVDIRNTPKVNNSHIRATIRPKINNMIVNMIDVFSFAKSKEQLLKLIRIQDEELAGYLAYIEHVNKDQFNQVLDYAFKRLTYIKSLK